MITDNGRYFGLRAKLLGMTALAGFCSAILLPAADANAGGFALKEQSTAALGNAFAGATAGAEDVTYMFFNPAGLTRHDESQAAVVLSYIIVRGETNNAAMSPVINGPGESASGDAAEDALVPALYAMWSVNPDLKLAVGINAPFGLTTEYSQTWAGRYHAVESSITAVSINPVVAYRLNENISLGVGLQIQYFDVTLSNMVPLGAIDGLFEIEGDDWAYGFNVGAMFELSAATRIGVSYRSQMKQEISGDATLQFVGSTSADADLTTPDSASLGAYHDINEQWAVMGEIGWTGWSSFDEIRVLLGTDLGFGTVLVTPENWDDVWSAAIGVTWKPNEDWTLRGGVAFDQSPIPDATRTPRLTGEDRTWVAIGAQFHPSPNFTIDAGYTHLFVDDVSLDVTNAIGNFTGTYENSVDIVTLGATLRF